MIQRFVVNSIYLVFAPLLTQSFSNLWDFQKEEKGVFWFVKEVTCRNEPLTWAI